MARIMIINWQWKGFEPFKFATGSQEEIEKFTNGWNLGAYRKDQVRSPEGYQLGDYVIPIRVSVKNLDFEDRQHIWKSLLQHWKKHWFQSKEGKAHQFLLLCHDKQGFDQKMWPKVKIDNLHWAIFGSGKGILYGQQGGLINASPAAGQYFMAIGKKAAYWEGGEVVGVNEERFDRVWNSYLYRTSDKLFHLRAKIFQGALPKEPPAQQIQLLIKDYLEAYNSPGEPRQIEGVDSYYSFSNCQDIRDDKYHLPDSLREKLQEYADWKESPAGKKHSIFALSQAIIKEMNQLMVKWK
ncbi:MAG: hypothetical protein AAFR61_11085 [Bacteroidota bacterium]